MRFALTVTGPAYGTQQASSAAICQAVLQEGHELACVFFYREGVLNANQLTAPASVGSIWCAGGNPSTMSTASRCISAWRPPCVVA